MSHFIFKRHFLAKCMILSLKQTSSATSTRFGKLAPVNWSRTDSKVILNLAAAVSQHSTKKVTFAFIILLRVT